MNEIIPEPVTRTLFQQGPAAKTDFPRPRLGFLGVGWIGHNRLEAIAESQLADIVAIAEPVQELALQAVHVAPAAVVAQSLSELLAMELDGIVIATPSALHAEQALAALDRGMAVFCQKPLGRNADETCRVVDRARAANRLLGIDLSYRFTDAMQKMRQVVLSGEMGKIYAAEFEFHNAYGPDKAWFYDRKLSGGGCVIDLGIHLVDLALWILDNPLVVDVSSRLYSQGETLGQESDQVEDYAVARLDLANGPVVQIACSWKLAVGCDAAISAKIYGTHGGVRFWNVNGSFYDFVAERMDGTTSELLSAPPDEWSGRAAVDWVRRLAAQEGYDPEVERICSVASILDAICGR